MANEKAIIINNVSKRFILPHEKKSSLKSAFAGLLKPKGRSTNQHALKNISFTINKGEFFGIVGRNGSGKSTLLKIIAGIYQPTEGSVEVRGKLVPFIELGVGFNPELTGRENVYLNGAILGFDKKKIDTNYKKIVEFAELEDFMDQKLKNYSSGMQVRLAFACATMAEADILLVDEVLAVGDADFQRKCFDYFKYLKKMKKTVIFVTHDMNAVREYCDKAILINENSVSSIGKPNDVAIKYNKLFAEKATPVENMSAKKKRWGNGKIQLSRPKVTILKSNELAIEYTMSAKHDTNDIVVGFMIKNSAGDPIAGTNSIIKKVAIPSIKANESINVNWRLPNIFADGKYFVDPAIVSKNGTTIDWWEDATMFNINKDEKVPYIINPNIILEIELRE